MDTRVVTCHGLMKCSQYGIGFTTLSRSNYPSIKSQWRGNILR